MQLYIGEIQGYMAWLTNEEAKHFAKVLRGKVGQEINITDGLGNMAKGLVNRISNSTVEIELTSVIENFEKRDYKLHIAVCPTKNIDRTEFFIEKAVEIGIDEISFLKSFHSERKNINFERLSKIAQTAVKQSLKAYIPKMNDLMKFSDFISNNNSENKLIAHCNNDFKRKDLHSFVKPKTDYLILIGPEGDFSKEEIVLANDNGFNGISLGHQRFRTETAAMNVVFGINWVNLF